MTDPSNYVRQREKGARDISYPASPEPLAVPVYDNHAHLEIEDGQGMSLDEQLLRAGEVGVAGVVQAGGDIDSSRWSAWAAASHPRTASSHAHKLRGRLASTRARRTFDTSGRIVIFLALKSMSPNRKTAAAFSGTISAGRTPANAIIAAATRQFDGNAAKKRAVSATDNTAGCATSFNILGIFAATNGLSAIHFCPIQKL